MQHCEKQQWMEALEQCIIHDHSSAFNHLSPIWFALSFDNLLHVLWTILLPSCWTLHFSQKRSLFSCYWLFCSCFPLSLLMVAHTNMDRVSFTGASTTQQYLQMLQSSSQLQTASQSSGRGAASWAPPSSIIKCYRSQSYTDLREVTRALWAQGAIVQWPYCVQKRESHSRDPHPLALYSLHQLLWWFLSLVGMIHMSCL